MQSEWGHATRAQDLRRRIGSADVFARGAVSMDAPSEVSVPELTIVGDPLPRTRRVLGRVPFPVQVKTAWSWPTSSPRSVGWPWPPA